MTFRLLCTIFLVVSAVAFPLYFTLAVGVFAAVWFRTYWELVPIYFLNDILYGAPLARFAHVPFVMTILALILVFVSTFVHKQLFDTNAPRHYA